MGSSHVLYQSSSEAIKKALVGAVTFGQKSLQKGGVQFIRLLPPLSSAGDELTRECAYHLGSGRSSPRIRQATEFVQRLGHDLQDEPFIKARTQQGTWKQSMEQVTVTTEPGAVS